MKILLLVAMTATCLFVTTKSYAGCELKGCASGVAADAGVTAQRCYNPISQVCTAAEGVGLEYCAASWYPSGSACPTNYYIYDYRITDNAKLCVRNWGCTLPIIGDEAFAHATVVAADENLEKAFAPKNPNMADEYFGYVTVSASTTNRTGNIGRTTSAKARLDVCLGNTDVDTAISNGVSWCMNTACGTSYNEYCNATGTNDGASTSAAVCKDRCQCTLGSGTCDQL
jgi:hypothetical protein